MANKVHRRERPKDLKKQRWAAIVAAILAFGMLASVVGGYLGLTYGGGAGLGQEQADPQPEDYLAYYEGEVERLEEYLDQHDPSPPVLVELAENYRYLSFIQQMYFNDQEAVEEYQGRVLSIYETLTDLEPDNPRFRLELINIYQEQQKDESMISEEIAITQQLLRDNPDPVAHLSLIAFLDADGREDLKQEEVDWLYGHLGSRVAGGEADNEENLYYAFLLGEYMDEPAAAKPLLEEILTEESEDSWLYREAENYLSYLETEDDLEEDTYLD